MITFYADPGFFKAVFVGLVVAVGTSIDDIDEQVDDFVETGTPIEFEGLCSIVPRPLPDKPAERFGAGIAVIAPTYLPTPQEMQTAMLHLGIVTGRIPVKADDNRTICFREDCLPHQIPRMPTAAELDKVMVPSLPPPSES